MTTGRFGRLKSSSDSGIQASTPVGGSVFGYSITEVTSSPPIDLGGG